MTPRFFCRASLRRDAAVAALARLLVPDEAGVRAAASHRLVWSLFADGPERRRDFLWREERPGTFMTLSERLPSDPHGLFDLAEPKLFAPVLAHGDRLEFSLHANPVVARAPAGGGRSRHHDVVMDALRHNADGAARASLRPMKIMETGRAWLARQGAMHGFQPESGVAVVGYETVRLPRDTGVESVRFGVLDFQGVLTVTDPAAFVARLLLGFGRARAFGCGLMLIRRAR